MITKFGKRRLETLLANTSAVSKQELIELINQEILDVDTIPEIVSDPTGYRDKSESTINFNELTRVFSISPVSGSFVYYINGVQHTINETKSIELPDTTGSHLVYFDKDGELHYQDSFDLSLFRGKAFTALVAWNSSTQQAILVGDERHEATMSWASHSYLHNTRGLQVQQNAFVIGDFVIGEDGSSDSHCQFSLTGGRIYDEDLAFNIVSSPTPAPYSFEQNLAFPAKIPLMYKLGASGNFVRDIATDFAVKQGSGAIQYNKFDGSNWTVEDLDNDNCVPVYIFATDDIREPIVAILGQQQFDDLNEAMEYQAMDFSGLPTPEMKLLYQVIFWFSSSYTNSTKSVILDVKNYLPSVFS